MKTLAEIMAELPEERRLEIEARAQVLIAEEEARRARRRENGATPHEPIDDEPIDIEDAEPLAQPAD